MDATTYTAVPEGTLFLKPDDAMYMCILLRHVIAQCETHDVEDYPMPLDLSLLRSILRRLDV